MRIARFAAPEGLRFAVADPDRPSDESIRWLDLGLATPALQAAILSGQGPVPGMEIWPDLPLVAPLEPNRIFAVVGDGVAIVLPAEHAEAIDYEGELAVVIGSAGRRVPVEDALTHVAGYTVANDVTARDVQDSMAQWTLPKSMATFAPLGPHLLTAEEIPDPQSLTIETRVGDEVRQEGHTKDMIFSVAQLISFLSDYVDLEVGDVIETGTPAGVGWRRKPKAMLQPGQEVEVRIEPIGRLRNSVRAEATGPGD